MGQARLRGTKDERVAAAEAGIRLAQARRDAAEMEREQEKARQWAAMSQEQKDAALERAKRHARNYGELQEMFGPDIASALAGMM